MEGGSVYVRGGGAPEPTGGQRQAAEFTPSVKGVFPARRPGERIVVPLGVAYMGITD